MSMADWADALEGVEVIESPFIPPNVMYLAPKGFGPLAEERKFSIGLDVWPPAPYWYSADATRERRRALGHLSDQLDDLCARWGIDPEVWRKPARRRLADRDQLRYMAEERLALSVVNPATATSTARITIT